MLILILAGGMGVYVISDPFLNEALIMVRAASLVRNLYHEQIDWETALDAARQQMFDRLDRYSSYVKPDQFERMDEELSGTYGGIGVSVIDHEDGLLIMSVREGAPAAKVGLMTGDLLVAVDSVVISEVDFNRAASMLRGEEGTTVALKIYRSADRDTLEVRVTRAMIQFIHVAYAGIIDSSILYIRVLDFNAGTSSDIRAALDSLLSVGPYLTGIVMDLRGNPGGLFREAYRTASLFLERGTFIVGTDGRSRWHDHEYRASGHDLTDGLPMAVLVDRGSASSTEIVAGALQQAGRAVLVGDTTFGKGLVQGYVEFPDGDGIRLTMSRYYLYGGLYLNEFDSALNEIGSGLPPDCYIASERRHPFPRALENSMLLQSFANRNRDDIIEAFQQGDLDDGWVDEFALFARKESFEYVSQTRRQVEQLAELVDEEGASSSLDRTVNRLYRSTERSDWDNFLKYSDYIKRRLAQLAYESKFGRKAAYEKVITRFSPEIDQAVAAIGKNR